LREYPEVLKIFTRLFFNYSLWFQKFLGRWIVAGKPSIWWVCFRRTRTSRKNHWRT